MSAKNSSKNVPNNRPKKALRTQPKPLEVPDWFGDGSDIPTTEHKTDTSFNNFPDWASHQEWEAPPANDSNECLLNKILFKTPYSTEDNIHVWDRQEVKLPPINQKLQNRKITKAEKPFWNPKPEKSYKSPNSKGAPVQLEPENIKMFDLISMQYQKDWLSQTKHKEHERIQKIRHLKEQQKAKLLEHAVKKRDTNSVLEDTIKEPFKLTRFSNVPSRYLDDQLIK